MLVYTPINGHQFHNCVVTKVAKFQTEVCLQVSSGVTITNHDNNQGQCAINWLFLARVVLHGPVLNSQLRVNGNYWCVISVFLFLHTCLNMFFTTDTTCRLFDSAQQQHVKWWSVIAFTHWGYTFKSKSTFPLFSVVQCYKKSFC